MKRMETEGREKDELALLGFWGRLFLPEIERERVRRIAN